MIMNFLKSSYNKVKETLTKTGSLLGNKIRSLLHGEINEETLETLEQTLYEADIGVATTKHIIDHVRNLHLRNPSMTAEDYFNAIRDDLILLLGQLPTALNEAPAGTGPTILLVVGVNGSGKTTSIAKLTQHLQSIGKKVVISASDTFRAAAVEQLETWAGRLGADIVKGAPNGDPSAVAFDAITAAKARNADVVLIDTAGRLQNKTHLMQELEKIKRTCNKLCPGSPHETLLVLDANTGQNGIDQAKIFHQFTPITGIILTKLDGTAKGGFVIATQKQLNLPVKFIGIGEGLDDLKPFEPNAFVNALLE